MVTLNKKQRVALEWLALPENRDRWHEASRLTRLLGYRDSRQATATLNALVRRGLARWSTTEFILRNPTLRGRSVWQITADGIAWLTNEAVRTAAARIGAP